MSSKFTQRASKNRALLALSVAGLSPVLSIVQGTAITVASADTEKATAGSFDLTKQATVATFPVMFDRPSGVNTAALAGTIRNLGTDSELYKSAVKAVPELANASKMNSLLGNALGSDTAAKTEARETIVKLINWYNSLGGTKITTQSGATYTSTNLDEPINVLAVAFSNDGSINAKVSSTISDTFKNVKTVQDVMNIFDGYKAGTSSQYKSAFDAYAAKVYANGADIAALSTYESVKPVLDAYENMYANGATAIRQQLLDGSATATEAGVTFFESAVITGKVSTSDNGGSDSNTPVVKNVKTRWVDESGKELAPSVTGPDYDKQREFDGYTYKEVTTKDGVRTYVYTKKPAPTPDPVKEPTKDTVWVDEAGNTLKPKADGEFPDKEGDDIPGYTIVSTKTTKDSDGNVHVVNTYKKTPEQIKPDTYWFDSKGNTLKEKAVGKTLPDTDGVTDIPGYKVLRVYTITKADLAGDFKDSGFKVGDTINIYEKEVTPEEKKPTTKWVDTEGNPLKDPKKGSFPDKEGDDIPGYKIVSTTTDEDGNVTNVYKKVETPKVVTTKWVDTEGNPLKDPKKGSFPDKEGDDIPGWTLDHTKTDEDGNVTNVYKKVETPKVVTTKWVDEAGNPLQKPKEGAFPDKEGDDIVGYTLVRTDVDKDGNVTNIYKVTPKQVITHWVTEDGTRLTDDETGKEFGAQKSFDGYKLIDTRMSEDGTEKFYIYRPVTETPKETPKETPATPAKELPKTGDVSGVIFSAIGASGVGASLGAIFKRRNKRK